MKTIKVPVLTFILVVGVIISISVSWRNLTTHSQVKTTTVQQAWLVSSSSVLSYDVKSLTIISSSTNKDSKSDPLTRYVFNSYSPADGQLLIEGELLPTSVQTESYEMQGKVSVVFRCWKKEMYCAFSEQFHKWGLSSQLDLLAVKSWDNNLVAIKGVSGNYPDCSKHSCSSGVEIIVDLEKSTAVLKESFCGSACATDEYLIIGEGDGVHKTRVDLPDPKVSLVNISF